MKYKATMLTIQGHTYYIIKKRVLFFWRYVLDGRWGVPKLFTHEEKETYLERKGK